MNYYKTRMLQEKSKNILFYNPKTSEEHLHSSFFVQFKYDVILCSFIWS